MSDAERISRERDFHNQRFADDSQREQRVGRYYAAIDYGFELYRRKVAEASRARVVVEYGCGTGNLAFDLAGTARQVFGIDISDVAIQQARAIAALRDLRNVEFVVDDAEAMQFETASVDVVAGSGIVHHLDIGRAMQEVRRVLRKGGTAIFAEPMGHNPVVNWYRNRTPELRTPDEHPLLTRDLREMARGFSSIRVTYFGLVAPALGLIRRRVDRDSPVTRWVSSMDRSLCAIPLLNRYSWFSLIELDA